MLLIVSETALEIDQPSPSAKRINNSTVALIWKWFLKLISDTLFLGIMFPFDLELPETI